MNSKFLSFVLSGMCCASLTLNCNGAESVISHDNRVEFDIFNLDASELEYENRAKLDSAISKLRKYLVEMNLEKVLDLKLKGNEYLCGYYGKGTTLFIMNNVAENQKLTAEKLPMAVVGHIVNNDTFIMDTFYCYYQIIQYINDPYYKEQGNCQNPRANMPEDWIINQYVMFGENFSKAWKSLDQENEFLYIDTELAKAFCNKISKVSGIHVENFFKIFLSRHDQIKRIVLPDVNPKRSSQLCYAPLDLVCKALRNLGFNKSGFDEKDKSWFLCRE